MKRESQQEKFLRMTTAPIPGLVAKLAVPTVISMIVTAVYNMADTYFVGTIGNESTTGAVGIALSIMALIQAIGFTVGMGSGNYISRLLGKQDFHMAEKVAMTGFTTVLSISLVFSAVCLIFLDKIVLLLGATETIAPLAQDYIRIILYAAPFTASSFTLNNILRYQGNAVYSMIGIATGGVLNIILDPIFISFMGLEGAATATAISQFVSFCMLFFACFTGNNIRLKPKNFSLKDDIIKEIFRIGMPSFWRQGMASIAAICLNYFAGIWGNDAAVAAMTVVNKVFMFAQSILIGFAQGFQPVCGFNFGAGKNKRVIEAFYFCIKVGIVIMTSFSVFAFICSPQLIKVFRDVPAVIEIGTKAMRYQAVVFPLATWTVMCNMLLQSVGRALPASVLSMARQGLFFIPAILILPAAGLGLLGVELSQAVADLLSFALALLIGFRTIRELSGQNAVQK